MLNYLFIYSDMEYHQLLLPTKHQTKVFQMLHDGQGYEGMDWILCREKPLLEYYKLDSKAPR